MQRDLGRVDMVYWQGRRLAPEQRAKSRALRLTLVLSVVAAVSLMAGFYSGLPIPISVLQTVFALVGAAVLGFGAWTLANAVIHRGERARISRYRH